MTDNNDWPVVADDAPDHQITVTLKSDRTTEDLTSMVSDLLIDLAGGYLGDESDWFTFKVTKPSA